MVCRNIVGTLRFFSWRGVGDMIVKYATIEAVNLCTCNATGFCAPVTHDASEVSGVVFLLQKVLNFPPTWNNIPCWLKMQDVAVLI